MEKSNWISWNERASPRTPYNSSAMMCVGLPVGLIEARMKLTTRRGLCRTCDLEVVWYFPWNFKGPDNARVQDAAGYWRTEGGPQ